ncbi:MAG: ComF family protein [Bacteroidales bacterium]|nr:ComF family protein [Bacteroidales bacterium]
MTFRDWLYSILNLFYPRVCAACGETLLKDEETVCLKCRYTLPFTGYENHADNPLAQVFYGRVRFHAVTACFFFAKSGKVQHLIHELKYKNNPEAGVFLGQELGKTIKDAPLFQGIDYLIPVPLHPRREKQRGYNQSLLIAQGINEVTGIPIGDKYLIRAVYTTTQTKKSADERHKNVKDIFEVRFPEELEGKHILLIDDVLTTGATLESCAHQLENIPGIMISAATAACAGN